MGGQTTRGEIVTQPVLREGCLRRDPEWERKEDFKGRLGFFQSIGLGGGRVLRT